jgi:hypothetical protein
MTRLVGAPSAAWTLQGATAMLIRPDEYAVWASDAPAPGERLSAGRAALQYWCGDCARESNGAPPHAMRKGAQT